ncbi:MAG: hypothetical protein KY468_09410 [Armatimonadetes bacterium]|nr:hypothetical protein [Armatimonadota bacterium]
MDDLKIERTDDTRTDDTLSGERIQHGIDDSPEGDPAKGAVLGGIGGAAVGAAAGAPGGPAGMAVGAVIGGVAGAAGAGAAVAAVDSVDNDNNITGLGDEPTRVDDGETQRVNRDEEEAVLLDTENQGDRLT